MADSTTSLQAPSVPGRETDAERRARIAREAAVIAQAEADLDAGRGLDDEALEAWLDRLDVDPNAKLPT
jgi:hypothetical protein